ncbi:hypothetical protein J6590_033523 [Homalodisca vitripennis]|nr:hypothetical protein J6590_033523 [Homalodisca vitripennis]
MPLFGGKKDSAKKSRKEGKDADKTPSVEDKYILKEMLGTKFPKHELNGFLSGVLVLYRSQTLDRTECAFCHDPGWSRTDT